MKGILYPWTISRIAGLFANFFQFLRWYFHIATLGRLEIFGGNRDAIRRCIWLNSVGDRSSGMLRSVDWEDNVTFFWHSWKLWNSLSEETSLPVSSGSKQGDTWKGIFLQAIGVVNLDDIRTKAPKMADFRSVFNSAVVWSSFLKGYCFLAKLLWSLSSLRD